MEGSSISSKILAEAVAQFAKLPGIGRKTALRLVLHLLKQDEASVEQFISSIGQMHRDIRYCSRCYNIADSEVCGICSDRSRNAGQVCVVEHIKDVITIESTGQYNGVYHVLGGLIAPLEGVGPDQLYIEALLRRCGEGKVEELIMALNPTIEGDTTVYYISKALQGMPAIRITSIARGVAFGGELEYTDELTLGKALSKRLPVDNYINIQSD